MHLKKPMNQEKTVCVECESDYFKNSSEMAELCPNCAHELYGYANCEHKFDNGNCTKCGWNGKTSEYLKNPTEKITLETESYLIEGKENERFFPFLELEFNEDVIYENDIPKYYLSFSEDLKSAYGIGKWIMTELKKNNHDLRKTINLLGQSMNLNWDIFSTNVGKQIDGSCKSEKIQLTILTDNVIEKIKTHHNNV